MYLCANTDKGGDAAGARIGVLIRGEHKGREYTHYVYIDDLDLSIYMNIIQ